MDEFENNQRGEDIGQDNGHPAEDINGTSGVPQEDGLTDEEYERAEAATLEETAAARAEAGATAVNWWKEIYEWVQAIAIAVVLALIINQFLFSIVQVDGTSMVPTLHDGERLIVTKLFYQPKNHDIVIIKSSQLKKHIVKRVIAVSGQTVDIDPRTGDVTVDGEVLDEPYIKEKLHSAGNALQFPLTVDEDSIFVMGDNRNNSTDSRMIGLIPKSEVVGKASLRIWPLSKFGGLYEEFK